MSEEKLSSIKQKFKQLIAGACMTFQGTRGARHGAQPWQKHHFPAKEFMRKIGEKGISSSILARFQKMMIIGRKNGANIWITSEQSIFRTKPLQNNWNDTLRCIIFGTIQNHFFKNVKSRPDYHQTTRAILSMHKEASQIQKSKKKMWHLPQGSGPREARLACMAFSQLEKVLRGEPNLRFKFHTMASPKISRSACLGKPRSIHK